MTIKQINVAYHDVFKKFLHVRLQLVQGVNYSQDFLEEFNERWRSKETALAHLIGTRLDTNRWEFGDDLSIQMMSVAKFDQIASEFTCEPIIFADFEAKVKDYHLSVLMKLHQYLPEQSRASYLDYIAFTKQDQWSI